jgi:N-acetylmuramoyl-L-alanine amidase
VSSSAPKDIIHRDSGFRIAVFFRRCFPAALRLALVCVAAGIVLPPVAAGVSPRPPGKTPATVRIGETSYAEARAWFTRLGYRPSYAAETRTLTLENASGKIVFTDGSRDARLNGMRIFLGEPALLLKGYMHVPVVDLERFITPILRPAQLPPRPLRTIVLDAGHGGNDTGTRNQARQLDEKLFTLDVAQRLRRLLRDDKWRVLLTRDDDRFISLADRAEFANSAKADLFVSIHFNAVANNPSVRGTETYVLTPQHMRSTSSAKLAPDDNLAQPGNKHDAWSAVLGYHMHRELLARLKTEDRGYKRARFAVLRLVDCPAVLVEAGYLSNNDEAGRIADEAYRAKIAEALYTAILAYDSALASAGK